MTFMKVCGITRASDAYHAVRHGASALGFVFWPQSPRYIAPDKAAIIISELQDNIQTVGVFVDQAPKEISRVVSETGISMVQLHGDETPEFCSQVGLPVIKAFRISPNFNYTLLHLYDVYSFLFDTYVDGKYGGTGNTFNWDLVKSNQNDIPIILSGGLNVKNIKKGINQVSPSCVDVNSGIESSPGKKDEQKMKALYNILKNIDAIDNMYKT